MRKANNLRRKICELVDCLVVKTKTYLNKIHIGSCSLIRQLCCIYDEREPQTHLTGVIPVGLAPLNQADECIAEHNIHDCNQQ